ncbi:hypothetical protein CRG98_020170 [Punica granatum]|uniref:Uncharacterized protein n=1 Tax=Punica granatum TaxID=22663 RepID=A0A2I0JT17_PUNGR|nr:hypothetical protein CRG98_020170 [Punica granatum]
MRAGMDAGDGSGHRSGFAVVDRGLTGVKQSESGRILGFSGEGFPSSPISKFLKTGANFPISLNGSCSSFAELPFPLINFDSFPFSLGFRPIWRKSRKSRFWGGSWAGGVAGSRRVLPGPARIFFF